MYKHEGQRSPLAVVLQAVSTLFVGVCVCVILILVLRQGLTGLPELNEENG